MPTTGIVTELESALGAITHGDDDVGTPPLGVCIAFDDDTLEPRPTWTRLDDPTALDLVQGWSIDRGRQGELDKTKTGTATVNLIDTDGTLDPTNASGPFYGKLDPMKQAAIALQNPVTEEWTTLFRGFVADWSYQMDVSQKFTNVTLELTDAFDLLAALEMTPGHHGDTTPTGSEGDIFFNEQFARDYIHKILDDAGWPTALRTILTGNIHVGTTVQIGSSTYYGTLYARRDQLLTALLDAADAEFPGVANVYVSKTGKITFHGRYARFDPTRSDYGIDSYRAGDEAAVTADPTRAIIAGLDFRRSKDDIINAALCLPQGIDDTDAIAALIKDDTSIATYGWRSLSYVDLLILSARTSPRTLDFTVSAVDEGKLYSQFYVENQKAPRTRVSRISFRPKDPDDPLAAKLWKLMCEVEIGDVIPLKTTHPGGGGFDEDFYVEGIRYNASPMREDMHDITLDLDVSPASLYAFNPFA